MTAELRPEPQTATQVDSTVTATIRGLAAARNADAETVARVIGVDKATYYRRIKDGGWRAAEVGLVAEHFGVPVGDLYAGRLTVTYE